MPFSSTSGKDLIRWAVSRVPNATMLDVGCGCGTYAKMFPNAEMTGIEIWKPYVEQYGLRDLYKDLIVQDVRDWEPQGKFHVAFLGDILEHMSVEDALMTFNKVRAIADTVIISIPIGHYPQGEFEGNPHEAHVVDDWKDENVKSIFGDPSFSQIDNEIGVYIYSVHNVRPKICVYAISKNEKQFVKRFCESAKDADLIMIADTGSTDGMSDEARSFGAVVHDICITPWRFDHARNAALSLIPREIDICISLDLDEVMEDGWREEIERVWMFGRTTRLRYLFDWGCGIAFKYEKIHARHGYHWHHPCHEYPVPDGRIQEIWADTDKLLVSHHPDPTKSRGQYLDLLELSVKEDPECPRNGFYYARELTFHYRWNDAIEALNKYLSLPRATWQNERCYAMRLLGKAYDELGNQWQSESWYHRACGEAPNTREPWCELAMLMYRQQRWHECFAYSMRALQIKDKALVYTCDPAVWAHWPHDLASISAWNIGMKDVALEQAKLAVEKTPDDARLQANVNFILKEAA